MKLSLSLSTMFYAFCICSFVVLAGCDSDDRVSKVHGTVTLDGEPVDDASVAFTPSEGGRPSFAVTDADGNYELTTFKQGDGAVIGSHIVTITAVDETVSAKAEAAAEEYGSLSEVMVPNQRPKQVWRVPEVFSDAETSGLTFEVKSGEDNVADFSLDSK